MIPLYLRCACGTESIPGSLWTAEHTARWHREHDAHGGPVARPEALTGTLPSAEAVALRRELRWSPYVVGVTDTGRGIASVYIYERGMTRA